MHDPMPAAQTEGAEAYERLMVPALFAEWAPTVATLAAIAEGDAVLDVACGTGVLAREAARRAGDRGSVSGIDANAGMLAVARRIAPRLDWRQAEAESLPFAAHTFDAVVSQFGLMFFRDLERALGELVRVLKPGGRYALAVWDALAANRAYAIEVAIVEEVSGARAADPIRAPYALGDRDALRARLEAAGLRDVAVTTRSGTARFPGVQAMVQADLLGWLPVMGVTLPDDEIAAICGEAERRLADYVQPDGTIAFPTSVHVAYGRRAQQSS